MIQIPASATGTATTSSAAAWMRKPMPRLWRASRRSFVSRNPSAAQAPDSPSTQAPRTPSEAPRKMYSTATVSRAVTSMLNVTPRLSVDAAPSGSATPMMPPRSADRTSSAWNKAA